MKTKFLKCSFLVLAVAVVTATKAQDKSVAHRIYSSYDVVDSKTPGKLKETIKSSSDGNEYRFALVNGNLTELFVNDMKIPADKYSEYATTINRIKKQIRLDKIQAARDEEQAKLDQKQALKDQEQAKRDEEQAVKEQAQAKLDQEQAVKDQEQAKLDQEQATRDQEQAQKDEAQAKVDQEQALKDQAQAKIDEEQAKEDQKLMSSMISDLIKDGIVPDEKSLFSLSLNATEMTVNGKKQPDDVFLRYKQKYSKFSGSDFTYEIDSNGFTGIHMSRHKN